MSFSASRALVLLLSAYLALGTYYSLITPLFEAPDESSHFFVVREIVEHGGLPVQPLGTLERWHQEGSQPPLYYLLGAALTFWTDASDWRAFVEPNPYAVQGDPLALGNRNVYLHSARDELPWQGTVLAVHVLRLVSLLVGALSVVSTFALARTLVPAQPFVAVGAAAFHVFLPQFLFISSAVNNDALATLLGGAVLWQSARVLRGAHAQHDSLMLGALVGLAALTKLSGLAFGLLALAAVLLPPRLWRERLRDCVVVALMAALIAGWWYARNFILYGDPTGLNRMLAIVGTRNPAPDLWQLLDESEGLRLSFFGVFGWFSVLLPTWLYEVYELTLLIALLGIGIGLVLGRVGWRVLILPALAIVLVLVGVLRWGTLTPGLQGRLLFPA
ncbi:MAG: glycosyltransferase family 39 protein, partial [Chloroflexi bacterium]|nr:glycosyltransferase family 39 protein [Chloroflexota bacterium]